MNIQVDWSQNAHILTSDLRTGITIDPSNDIINSQERACEPPHSLLLWTSVWYSSVSHHVASTGPMTLLDTCHTTKFQTTGIQHTTSVQKPLNMYRRKGLGNAPQLTRILQVHKGIPTFICEMLESMQLVYNLSYGGTKHVSRMGFKVAANGHNPAHRCA